MSCASPNALHWEDLRSRPVEEVLDRGGVRIASDGQGYEVDFLGAVYKVDAVEQRILEIFPNPDRPLTEEFQILLIRYLVAPNTASVEGTEISEKDLPGGVTFFQGPHALHLKPITRLYGSDPEGFERRGLELGAVRVPYGDRAMRFYPFPQIPVTYVLWQEDAEFPASVSVMFDRSIGRWFELDMIFTLVLVLTERIVEVGPL
ncbi:MAG: DUF3786 domain-containing protein [Desulfomonile sp.]|nr:DUF3786 domain-containing protein [Desulfomonile sp.]